MRSNVFGWSNSFDLGGSSSLNGLMLVGDRKQARTQSGFEYQSSALAPDQGKSHLILQSLSSNLGGGTVKFDFQDVSKNFSGFGAVTANGYSADTANQLSKEKGLKRMGFSMDKVQLGSLGFSNSYRTVGDEKGGITWQDYSIASGGLSLNYKSQKVDPHFTRFNDIAETNRVQLAKEAGIERQSMDASWKLGFGSFSYNMSAIDDTMGKGINRSDLKLTTNHFNFDLGRQGVYKAFTRFSSLNDPDAPQWGKESGLKRNWLSFSTQLAKDHPLAFSQSSIDSAAGGMKNMDFSANTGKLSIEHIDRSVDAGFTALPNLKPDEIKDNINAISKMYVKGGLAPTPDMQGQYFQSPGLSRDFTRLNYAITPKWNFGFETLRIDGKQDGAQVDNFCLTGSGFGFTYRKQELGTNFNQLTALMPFEQRQLGTMVGLDRTDLSLNSDFRRGAKLAFSRTNADSPTGAMDRQTLAYSDKTMQLNVNSRMVDKGFTNVNQMLDPEAGMLSQMVGFKETDGSLKWQASKDLHIEAMSWDGVSGALNQHRALSNLLVNWGPNKNTLFEFQHSSSDSNNPLDSLLANVLQRMSLTENFGKSGILKFTQQSMNYDPTVSKLPDSKTTDLSYEAKLTDKTSLKTEQIKSDFANGDQQTIQQNTINTEITKRAGLSLTVIAIYDHGRTPDERNRNVGFWVSLWNGLKLNYGVNDDLNSAQSTTQHTVSVTPGTVGNMQINNASYVANTWAQNDRTQAMSMLSLNTVKPFTLGFLRDMKFSIGQDVAADNGFWQKENKTMALSGRIGHNSFGYNYFGQMNTLHQRGVDRTFSFATDKSDTSRLSANLVFKQRTLPGDQEIAMRNYAITARPMAGIALTNEMITNPETPRNDVILGSLPQPLRVNRWKLDYTRDPNCKITGSWEEQRNDDTNALSRLGGVTFTLFEKSGSPVSLFLGAEQHGGNVPDHVMNRWSLQYNQRPGPNQALSLFIGNVTYGGTLAAGEKHRNLSVDFQYQYRFGTH